jgi:hemerythrin superfamily protein
MAGVVTLIKDDHAKLEKVFKQLEAQKGDVKELLRQVEELLVPHSKAEEEVVYPAIKSAVPKESEDVDDGLAEHHHVEQTLTKLLAMDPDAPGADGLVAAMIGEVRHHVEEEEDLILPKFSKELSSQQLTELGEQFTAAKEKHLAALRASR